MEKQDKNIHDIARQYMRQDRTRPKTSKDLRQHDTRQDKTTSEAKPRQEEGTGEGKTFQKQRRETRTRNRFISNMYMDKSKSNVTDIPNTEIHGNL